MPQVKDEPGASTLAEGVKQRQEAKEKSVREYYENSEKAKPTPTQEENDLAKVGALDPDSKEDDGSGSDEEITTRVMQSRIPSQNPYNTRDLDAKALEERKQGQREQQQVSDQQNTEQQEQVRRGPGRPPRVPREGE